MSVKTKLRGFQIVLLELYKEFRELDHALASYRPVSRTPGWDFTGYVERERRLAERELKRLAHHIEYLKRKGYIERAQEGERRLFKLTSKGEYELLKLRFTKHMLEQNVKPWDRKWRILVFDVPEERKKYRNFFRHLLKKNGFQMIQRSVWITPFDPQPLLAQLLKYLGLEKFFEFIEANCNQCSASLLRRYKP